MMRARVSLSFARTGRCTYIVRRCARVIRGRAAKGLRLEMGLGWHYANRTAIATATAAIRWFSTVRRRWC